MATCLNGNLLASFVRALAQFPSGCKGTKICSVKSHQSSSFLQCQTGRILGPVSRCFSTKISGTKEVLIYSSNTEEILKMVGVGSMVQAGVCGVVAGLVTLHPAAAQSALMPEWTFQGRATLGGLVVGFGASIAIGCKGFLSKNIVRVATLPSEPGSTCHKVPRKEFYAITAAYGGLDLGAESKGVAPVVPVFVGGPVMATLLLNLGGGILDKERMHELLSADGIAGVAGDAGRDEQAKKPFIPNRHRSKLN